MGISIVKTDGTIALPNNIGIFGNGSPSPLAGWDYRKKLTIDQTDDLGAGVNYQCRIDVHYGDGTDVTGAFGTAIVHTPNATVADFDDIRFTSSDGSTLLDHWLESYTASTSAVFWVEVPMADDAADVDIYIYWGGTDTSASNGANTFVFFDHFTDASETLTFQKDGAGTPTWSRDTGNSIITLTGASSGNCYGYKDTGIAYGRCMTRLKSTSENPRGLGCRIGDTSNWICGMDRADYGPYLEITKYVAASWTEVSYGAFNSAVNTWYKMHMTFSGNTVNLYVWDDSYGALANRTGTIADLTTNTKHGLFGWMPASSITHTYDYLAIGNYTPNEPTWETIGTTESFTIYTYNAITGNTIRIGRQEV